MDQDAEDYFWIMAARNRLLMVDEGRTALCTFFLLQDESQIPRFYDRRCWTTPQDYPDGTLLYIDKLMAHTFNQTLFRALVRTLTDRFPQWEQMVWYRPRPGQQPDRRYTFRRDRGGVHANLYR